jgi:hypothetical protein
MRRHARLIRGYLVIYLLLSLILSFAGQVREAAAQNHWVTFVLQDEKTKASLAGVNFSFSGPGFNKSGIANGSVKLGPLVSGRFMVSFKKIGYIDFNSGLDVTANRSFTVTLANRADVKAVAPPKNLLTIWPLTANRSANISDATVTVSGPSGQKSITVTKQVFAANFYDLKPGRYSYTVSHPLYQPSSGTVDMDETSKKTLQVKLGEQPIPVTVRVTLTNGQPAASANVVASGTRQVQASTNASGVAQLNLGPGTWAIQAYRSGLQPAVLRDIKLPGQTSFNLKLNPPTGNLSLRVIDSATNGAIENADIVISGPNGTFKARTFIGGTASFNGIPQGDYTCRIDKIGYLSSTNNLRLATAGTLQQTFKLSKPKSNLNVKALDALTRRPISGAQITAKWSEWSGKAQSSVARTDANGLAQLNITNPYSPVHSLIVTADGYKTVTLKSIKLPANPEVDLRKATAIGPVKANLEIQAVDHRSNQPLTGVEIIMKVNGSIQRTSTAGNGIAVFRGLPAGKYNFIASKTGYKTLDSKFARPIEIKESGTIRQTALMNAKPTTFEVRVVDEKGQPVSGARVTVRWRDSSIRRDKYENAVSGANGMALLYEVPRALTIYINASKKGYKPASQRLTRSYLTPPGKAGLRLASAK